MTAPDAQALVLIGLAERVEAASADEQRTMLEQAFSAIYPGLQLPAPGAYWPPRLTGFVAMLDADAFESAAMSLVPEGWVIGSLDWWPSRNASGITMMADDNGTFDASVHPIVRASAKTPALALTAACLRARAASLNP